MAGPENKENIESVLAKPIQLPRADQAAIMNSEGAALLPARPELTTKEKTNEEPQPKTESAFEKKLRLDEKHLNQEVVQHRIEDIAVLVARGEQERKALLSTMFPNLGPEGSLSPLAENFINSNFDESFIGQTAIGNLSQEALAKHLLECIAQRRGFDCSAQELAMLDSLEFQLMRILQHLNPNIRIQQQQQAQEDSGPDDDAASSGPEKVEDERESSSEGAEEADTEVDYSPSPRSKKGKAKARARDRRSRFRKWLARMMRAFGRNRIVMPTVARVKTTTTKELLERKYIITVRVFGKVTNSRTKAGIQGVKIISCSFGAVETSADGSFAFENVTQGITYTLAPLKAGYSFSPLAVNDVALDSKEHNFSMIQD